MNNYKLPIIVALGLLTVSLTYFQMNEKPNERGILDDTDASPEISAVANTQDNPSLFNNKEGEQPDEKTKRSLVSTQQDDEASELKSGVTKYTITKNGKKYQPTAGTVDSYAIVVDDGLWMQKISEGANEGSTERRAEISQFIYDNDEFAALNPQFECGDKLCGLLFQDIESEETAKHLVNVLNKSEIRGPFMHHISRKQDNGLYKTRIMLPKGKDKSLLATLVPELAG